MVIEIKRSDLRGIYKWDSKPDDDPALRQRDLATVNKHQGYEVLSFMNMMAKELGIYKLVDVERLERLIAEHPTNIQQREKLAKWIIDNWK